MTARQIAKEGDECPSCRRFWANLNQPPRKFVDTGQTTERGVRICVCAYCDGTPILRNNGRDVT